MILLNGKAIFLLLAAVGIMFMVSAVAQTDDLTDGFMNPPETARPWVYWFFMDGNLSREGMTADLEAMKAAGIGGVIIMEVDVSIKI